MDSFLPAQSNGQDYSYATELNLVTLALNPNLLQSCLSQSNRVTNKIKAHPLSNLNNFSLQQGLILQDLLFSLLGYEGSYIRYSEKYDATNIDLKINGPDFKIAKHLDISLKSITKKLVKFGKFYSGLNGFVEFYDQPRFGKIIQNLCYSITCFLKKYQSIIFEIEKQFKFNASFNLSMLENIVNQKIGNQLVHLYELVISIHDETLKRQSSTNRNNNDEYFLNFIQSIQNDIQQTGSVDLLTDNNKFDVCKGGLVLLMIQNRINAYKGDSDSLEFLTQLFDEVSKNYVEMLNKWLINGEVDDPFEEFVIKQNNLPDTLTKFLHSNMEKYWDEMYMTRIDGLIDQFKSKDIQTKILSTGKFLNVFKHCTGLDNFDNLKESLNPITSLYTQDFELKIDQYYERSNKLFMKLLFEGYNVINLIDYLQSTYLLHDSSNIDNFLDKSFTDLRRNKYSIPTSRLIKSYNDIFHTGFNEFRVSEINENLHSDDNFTTHQNFNIFSYYEKFSVDSTNFYDLAKEIINVKAFDTEEALTSSSSNKLRTLLNKALERNQVNDSSTTASAGGDSNIGDGKNTKHYDPDHSDDYSITAININLNLPFPLNLVITENYIFEYQLIFKLQMIIKFINKLLDNTWKEINYSTVWKYTGFNSSIKKLILRCRILHNRMKDFINELQYYINEEIIEANFRSLKKSLNNIEGSMKNQSLSTKMSESEPLETINPIHKKSKSLNFTHSTNKNSLFEDKINAQSNKFGRGGNGPKSNINTSSKLTEASSADDTLIDESIDIYSLINNVGSFLNNILKDSLITNKILIESIKNIFDIIILYNNYLNRLKKSLIMININLFESFHRDYPEKFMNKKIDEESINIRYNNLNNLLNSHFEIFNNSLTEFILNLKNFGESENQSFLKLIERLEICFPDN